MAHSGLLSEGPPVKTGLRSACVTVPELVLLVIAGGAALVGVAGLIMAQIGHFSLVSTAILTIVLGLVVVAVVLRLGLPRIVMDAGTVIVLVVVAIFAAWLYFPGFHYGAGDRDPGVYMEVADHIARTGALKMQFPLYGQAPVSIISPGALWPGIWLTNETNGTIIPQFYHMWSAMLAVGWKLHGLGGAANLNPLLGVFASMMMVLVGRRLWGTWAGAIAAVLLTANMMQVWQAKYPTTEILSQLLFLAAVLALLIAVQSGSRAAAFVGGLFIGITYIARPDGLVMVLLGLGAAGVIWILRRAGARTFWYVIGIAVPSIYGVYQAYVWAGPYTDANLPSGKKILVAVVAVAVLVVVLRYLPNPVLAWVKAIIDSPTKQRLGAWIVAIGTVVLFAVAVVRPKFGFEYWDYNGTVIRSFDERSLWWLSWFFTWPGLLIALLGAVMLVLKQRRSPSNWVVLYPIGVLIPLYLWHARNSAYLMWWGRRFVPVAVPGLILLITVVLTAGWWWRSSVARKPVVVGEGAPLVSVAKGGTSPMADVREGASPVSDVGDVAPPVSDVGDGASPVSDVGDGAPPVRVRLIMKGVGLLAAAGLLAVFLVQSVPLRSHDESGGIYNLTGQVAALAPTGQGIFVIDQGGPCCERTAQLIGSPLWLQYDQLSMPMPISPNSVPNSAATISNVKAYLTKLPDKQVFVVIDNTGKRAAAVKSGLSALKMSEVLHVQQTVQYWQQSSKQRPDAAVPFPVDFTVYRVTS